MSPEPPDPQLPQEIIDKIIDHVATDSLEQQENSILQCALVNRYFRPRSQQHIFSSIEIGRKNRTRTRDRRIQNLLNIIQGNPCLAGYTEELIVECAHYEYSWIYDNPAFLDVMKRISTPEQPLRKLTLKADKLDVRGFQTMLLENPEPLRDTFFMPFIAPFITFLSIHRLLNVPMELVTSCVNLVDLELLHVEWQEHSPTKRSSSHVIQLRSLKHRLSRAALDGLRAPTSNLDFSNLRSFTVYTDTLTGLDYEQQIIDKACECLEEIYVLTLNTPRNANFHGALDLQACTRLRQLHAHVLFPEDSLASIHRTLSTIRSGSLENIYIEAKVAFCRWDDTPPEAVFDADWASFSSEVARVMIDDAPQFEFKLTYLYKHGGPSTWTNEVKTRLGERCQSILATLRKEQLAWLHDPRFTVALSYYLNYDQAHMPFGLRPALVVV